MAKLKDFATPLAVFVLAGVLLFNHFHPAVGTGNNPSPPVSAKALGRTYGPLLVASYADAWTAAAKTLEDGKSVAEAQKTLQDSWKDARLKAFRTEIQPGMNLVLPEGTEPSSTGKRSEVVEFWRSFALGLKGASGH